MQLWDLTDISHARIQADLVSGQTGAVHAVTFSRDGRQFATASADGVVRIWETATVRPSGYALSGHRGAVYDARFSRDGTLLAAAGADGIPRLWHLGFTQWMPTGCQPCESEPDTE